MMLPRTATRLWTLPILFAFALSAPAATLTGTVAVKGDLKGAAPMLSWWGLSKRGTVDTIGSEPCDNPKFFVQSTEGVKLTFMPQKGAWTWKLEGVEPGSHLLSVMVVQKVADANAWPRREVWKWVRVKDAKDTVQADLALDFAPDAKGLGTIDPQAEGGEVKDVAFLPIEGLDPKDPILASFDDRASVVNQLRTGVSGKGKTPPSVKLTGLAPGKYRVFVDSRKPLDVEVKGGQTVTARAPADPGK